MSEVEALCDRIAVIYQGRVVGGRHAWTSCAPSTGEQLFERVFLRLIGEDPDAVDLWLRAEHKGEHAKRANLVFALE